MEVGVLEVACEVKWRLVFRCRGCQFPINSTNFGRTDAARPLPGCTVCCCCKERVTGRWEKSQDLADREAKKTGTASADVAVQIAAEGTFGGNADHKDRPNRRDKTRRTGWRSQAMRWGCRSAAARRSPGGCQ
ncbi:hypothetical protein B0T13DRAFT_448370 [Neurospora crassa]|nr:hypothetical protein B0T13DRAFT_448370 [Neurospora crassa]